MRRALVLAGGDFEPGVLEGVALEGARIVCVDRGLAHCLAAGLVPDVLIGDLDSVPPATLARADLASLPRLVFPTDKDASDLELALAALAGESSDGQGDGQGDDLGDGSADAARPDEVVVAGVSGGRTDHLLFNWLLPASRAWPFRLRFVDASVDARVVTAAHPLVAAATVGRTFSLLPLGRVRGVTTDGLRYALVGATLAPGTTRGLSNVVAASEVSVSVGEGTLLALAGRADASGTVPCPSATARTDDRREGSA